MRVESLLSARLFISPQLVDGRLYFISDLSGRLSLYAMDAQPGGSVPEPLLPPHIALQNPHLIGGYSFYVYPKLGKILLMLDKDGDEVYQPMLIPIGGGFPEPAFGDKLGNYRVYFGEPDAEHNLAYFLAASLTEAMNIAFRGHVDTGTLDRLGESKWGMTPAGTNADHTKVVLNEGYTAGDDVLYLWERGMEAKRVLAGTPLDGRAPDQSVPLTAFFSPRITPGDRGVLLCTALFNDSYGLGYLPLDTPGDVKPVTITGAVHAGAGELVGLDHIEADRYYLTYNIDGVSWLYEGAFDEAGLQMKLKHVLAGQGEIANGVLEFVHHDPASDSYSLSYSTATSPTQIYTVGGADRKQVTRHTRERLLGIPQGWLSPGEEASFVSFDGLRVSARLYLPAPDLGFAGPRPVVYYIHGGPQGQERPDFAWFSMPLIQYLTLTGFAVFVPNARGSSGYGLGYMKRVDHDWGGQDRLDHVHAMTEVLPRDTRLDVKRAGVVGRSYGGYMTLTQAARHPELWTAAVDMFGPYNLLTFMDRIPETWKPYFAMAVGDPDKDREFLVERSPSTYIKNIRCPLLIIQGKNDPRVIERESRDVVERLQGQGKDVEYLMFENEGHDVLKYENKVRCYNAITDFFTKHLKP